MSNTPLAELDPKLDPKLDGTLEAVRAALDAGLKVTSTEVWDLAVYAAQADERVAYRENGKQRPAYVGSSVRAAALIELLIQRGLPQPGKLLRDASRSPEVVDVLLRLGDPTQDEIDEALLATCLDHSFDPILAVMERVVAAKPSQAALDLALQRAASGTERYRGIAVDFRFFDVFDLLQAAGARADYGAGTMSTALHNFVTFSKPDARGDGRHPKRVARADAVIERAIASVASVDVLDGAGSTPLHVACTHGAGTRVTMLLAAGADRTLRNGAGKLPVECAGTYEEVYTALGVPPPPPRPAFQRPRSRPRPAPVARVADPFRVGAAVTHPKFGDGEVTASQGADTGRKLTIKFATGDQRTLAASFVTLKPEA